MSGVFLNEKIRPLGTLVEEFRYGTSNKSASNGRPTLRIPNVMNGRLDLRELKMVPVDEGEFGRIRLVDGDVLFVRTNGNPDYVGRAAVFTTDEVSATGFSASEFIYASYLIRARLKLDKLNPQYLRYYLISPHGREALRDRCRTSAGQYNINTNGLGSIPVPLPAITEQKRIADILDKADGIRRKRQEARDLTSEMPLSAFREIFRDYLILEAAQPPLGDVADVVSGVAKGRSLNGAETREVPYLRVANVQAGYLDLSEIKTIPAKESEVKELALQHGDVVMTEGGDHDKLGRGALWEHDVPDCIHQNHVFRVRTNRQILLPTFFVYYLQTEPAKGYFLRCAKKTTNLASINMTQLRALPVPRPPLKLQERFDDELGTIRSVIDRQNRAQTDADCLFHSLVQRAFKGEL